jgi:hypothetical protein
MNSTISPPAIHKAAADLSELARRINAHHKAGEAAVRKGLDDYRKAGLALLKAKEQCGHGKWLAWLKANVAFSERRARQYMALAKTAVTADLEEEWRRISGNATPPDDTGKGWAQPEEEEAQYPTPEEKEEYKPRRRRRRQVKEFVIEPWRRKWKWVYTPDPDPDPSFLAAGGTVERQPRAGKLFYQDHNGEWVLLVQFSTRFGGARCLAHGYELGCAARRDAAAK